MRAVALLAGTLISGLLFFGLMSNVSAQTIYKWVDTEGVTHFSARPPQNVEAERTAIRLRQSNRQALQARIDSTSQRNAAVATRKKLEKEQATEDQANIAEDKKIRADNCEKARTNLLTYNTARRLYRPQESGDREYLDDAELDSERAAAQKLVDEWCN